MGIPLSGGSPPGETGEYGYWRLPNLRDEPTPKANRYGVGSAARLKLREQMPHVGLDRLFGEEETLTDFAIHEPVRDELQHLDLSCRRVLPELARDLRGKGDNGAVSPRTASRSGCLEPTAVIAIAVQDLLTLSGVHKRGIGASVVAL